MSIWLMKDRTLENSIAFILNHNNTISNEVDIVIGKNLG